MKRVICFVVFVLLSFTSSVAEAASDTEHRTPYRISLTA